MFVVANLIQALAKVLDILLELYMWIIIIRALISWVNPDPYNPIVRFLYQATEPVLRPLRRFIPPIAGLDFTPLVAALIIYFLEIFLVKSLYELSFALR